MSSPAHQSCSLVSPSSPLIGANRTPQGRLCLRYRQRSNARTGVLWESRYRRALGCPPDKWIGPPGSRVAALRASGARHASQRGLRGLLPGMSPPPRPVFRRDAGIPRIRDIDDQMSRQGVTSNAEPSAPSSRAGGDMRQSSFRGSVRDEKTNKSLKGSPGRSLKYTGEKGGWMREVARGRLRGRTSQAPSSPPPCHMLARVPAPWSLAHAPPCTLSLLQGG